MAIHKNNVISQLQSFLNVFSRASIVLACSVAPAFADVGIDIHAVNPIAADAVRADFEVSVSNCAALQAVRVTSEQPAITLVAGNAVHHPGSAPDCSFPFSTTGASRLDPSLTLVFADGVEQNYSEHYAFETRPPSVSLAGVSLQESEGRQVLVVTAHANDDADLSRIEYAVTGLRASRLRAAGGVVDVARKFAFAATPGSVAVVPQANGQSEFSLALPVPEALSADEIANDGVVLVDLVAVDASGNRASVSEITILWESAWMLTIRARRFTR